MIEAATIITIMFAGMAISYVFTVLTILIVLIVSRIWLDIALKRGFKTSNVRYVINGFRTMLTWLTFIRTYEI